MNATSSRFQSLDLLVTLVAVVDSHATVLFANAALEDALCVSRRLIVGSNLENVFSEPHLLQK
ncbi:MAG: PAS domain-containing sensor histidine kinase, partial [Rhodoferax sp.]|nr:PAS domain-containing sensor histidine kinase [Rhodoferax sp.]